MTNREIRIPKSLLAEAGDFISGHMGLHFPESRTRDLERGLRSAARQFGFEDPEACTRWLISSTLTKSQVEVLASHLTVGETYFFRDKRCFDFLEKMALPELISLRRTTGKYLRIWSAGCCTGEEPYSIAILLDKMINDIEDWNITILGTDINPDFLRKASAGIYGNWSFRDAPAWVKERYFSRTKENRFELLPEIRNRVIFTYNNLAEDAYPSLLNNTNAMDLIFCRNVLMYSSPDHQRYVVDKLRQCLVEGGWLIVSPTEVFDALFSEFISVTFQGARFYRKGAKQPQKTVSFVAEEVTALPDVTVPHVWPPECPVGVEGVVAAAIELPTVAEEKPRAGETPGPYEKAVAYYEKGDYAEAAEELSPLLSEARHEAKAAALLARTVANQGRLSEALVLCERAVAADRCDPGNYYLLATILHEQGRLQDAASELRKALYLDQDFLLAHLLLGNLALRQGNRKESRRHFRNAHTLLSRQHPEEVIAGAEGLTAGRLMEIIRSTDFEDVA